jgi:hypothetical protein
MAQCCLQAGLTWVKLSKWCVVQAACAPFDFFCLRTSALAAGCGGGALEEMTTAPVNGSKWHCKPAGRTAVHAAAINACIRSMIKVVHAHLHNYLLRP